MQCHTLQDGNFVAGLPVQEHHFFVDGVVPNCRHNPVEVDDDGSLYVANPKFVQPRNGDSPFWVLESVRTRLVMRGAYMGVVGASVGHLILLRSVRKMRDAGEAAGYALDGGVVVKCDNPDGTKDYLYVLRSGIVEVTQDQKKCYLKCVARRRRSLVPENDIACVDEKEFLRFMKRVVAREAAHQKKIAEEEAKQQRQREEFEAEQCHWSKRTEAVEAVGTIVCFRHHSGVSLYEGHYRPTDTYIEVEVPGDTEKPRRTISVDELIRSQAGWKKITDKRLAALSRTRPAQIKLIGKREFEERDTGERRNPSTWYEPDSAELAAWITRAVAAVSSTKEPVAK